MDELEPGSRPREPMFNVPAVVLVLSVLLVAIYAAFAWASLGAPGSHHPRFSFRARAADCFLLAGPGDRPPDPGENRSRRAAAGAGDVGITGDERRSLAVDAPDLRLSARLLDARPPQHHLARRLWPPGRAALRHGAVSRLHGCGGGPERAGALGERADGLLPPHRSLGLGFGTDGRCDTVRLSARQPRSARPASAAAPTPKTRLRRRCGRF